MLFQGTKKLRGTRAIVYCAFFTALLIVLSQAAVPTSTIPFTLGLLGVFLCGCCLGPLWGSITVIIYIIMGIIGIPVFAGFRAIEALSGPTAGYIVGYVPAAAICGFATGKKRSVFILGLLAAVAACYIPGIIWTSIYLKAKLLPTFVSGMVYLPFDILKAIIAWALTTKLQKVYKKGA